MDINAYGVNYFIPIDLMELLN